MSSETVIMPLIPYGRTVCERDGSYLLYLKNHVERACPIIAIDRTADRKEAWRIATGDQSLIKAQKLHAVP
jgi:hypothetical protein